MRNLRGDLLFAVTRKNGEGLLKKTDKPDAFWSKIMTLLDVTDRQMALLAEFCGLPTVRGWKQKKRREPVCSVLATREWLAEQDGQVRSGLFPVVSSSKLCWIKCRRTKRTDVGVTLSELIKKRKEAWAKICGIGLEKETLANLNFYRERDAVPITAEMCASGAVVGDYMLQCAREALIERERRAAMAGWSMPGPETFFVATRWAESAIAADGLDYDIGDDTEE